MKGERQYPCQLVGHLGSSLYPGTSEDVMRHCKLIAGLLAAILLAIPDASAQTASPTGVWMAKKPLPVARNEVAAGADHGAWRGSNRI
jgi:hypothetical protein